MLIVSILIALGEKSFHKFQELRKSGEVTKGLLINSLMIEHTWIYSGVNKTTADSTINRQL